MTPPGVTARAAPGAKFAQPETRVPCPDWQHAVRAGHDLSVVTGLVREIH